MTTPLIRTLFAREIDRRIEEVIKVDQADERIIAEELEEYMVTGAIRSHYTGILETYFDTRNKPHEGVAVWVSGFFGSGKSSFAKILGLAIENRPILGRGAAERFTERAGDAKVEVLLRSITEQIPTHVVIFDVSTDRGIRSGNQTLTEITYGLFLQSLGYAKDLDLSELEITLEERGQLERFKAEYQRLYPGKEWDQEKSKIAFALSEASHVMHRLDPSTYPAADSWVKAGKGKADVSPGKLAERIGTLMQRRQPGKSLLLVVDEVGQFVARDVQKMLDLQGIVQNLGVKGRGKHWLVVTSQEKLGELVSGLDDRRVEHARLMDRFPLQVHLEPSDIAEVTSRRVLAKTAAAQTELGQLFDQHRGRLADSTRLTADVRLPDLARDSFVELYPLLPYQIDLIIHVVSGLRTQGGLSRHVGGANRTIIKLAQQLLIHPNVRLADQPLGTLARLDQVYDLVEGNIGSEVRAKIAAIPKDVDHPLAQPVAKAICLLQFVKSVHRTAENIAAVLHRDVGGDSQLPAVKAALSQLQAAHKIRLGDDGYRIPTPAEDDWERTRSSILPKPADTHRLHTEVLVGFWQPQPQHVFCEAKTFKAGLALHGRELVDGDLMFHLHLADAGKPFQELDAELRARSQQERKQVFWAVGLDEDIEQETRELHRSKEMLARKEREARTADETLLIGEEKVRLRRHHDQLRLLLKRAVLSGSVYFRGKDRSPGDGAADVGRSASEILALALPEVFERFQEAAARSADLKRASDVLLSAENLQGLPPVFGSLGLLHDEKGKTVLRTDGGPLAEVLRRIEERASYGDTASGRLLSEDLGKEPFGWDFEAVRLFVLCLLRAGRIDATSKGQTIDSATTADAKDTFTNNNLFRQAAFRPRKGIQFDELVKASEAFRDTFGSEVRELSLGAIVAEIRQALASQEDAVAAALEQLRSHRLPGTSMLESALAQMKVMQRGSDEQAMAAFNASHRSIKDAIKRAAELAQALTSPRLRDLERARRAMEVAWPFLAREPDLPDEVAGHASRLEDLLQRELFFRELPAIEQHASAVEGEYASRYRAALQQRIDAYSRAHDLLLRAPGWQSLSAEQQLRIAAPLVSRMQEDGELPIPQLRAETDACESRLKAAIAEVRRLVDGERLTSVSAGAYFAEGVETEEQLDAALTGLREECVRLIGQGKKVIVQ